MTPLAIFVSLLFLCSLVSRRLEAPGRTTLLFAKHVCRINMQGAAHRAGYREQAGEQYG